MASGISNADFFVWGVDNTAYGPVELPTLVNWIRDERVLADTWIFVPRSESWVKARDLPELQMFFRARTTAVKRDSEAVGIRGVDPKALRRIKILGTMSEEQLERFAGLLEFQRVPQWTVIVRQGDPGDTMYFILEGELRVKMDVGGRETTLTTLGVGEFFGDISLFDHGPRSADVVANTDCAVLKISAAALDTISKDAPDLAAAFLKSVGKTLTARIRADDKRISDTARLARAAE
jgi:CRP/FNR family cyclic AMP-dependent transcriptional regulator